MKNEQAELSIEEHAHNIQQSQQPNLASKILGSAMNSQQTIFTILFQHMYTIYTLIEQYMLILKQLQYHWHDWVKVGDTPEWHFNVCLHYDTLLLFFFFELEIYL